MDAVRKAALAVRATWGSGNSEHVVVAVLNAVGYDALRAERDHYREALEQIGAASPRNAYAIARKALGGHE